MSDSDDRRPTVTLNTALDRDIAHERGLLLAYLDTAIDALGHALARVNAGRAWLIDNEAIETHIDWLTLTRQEVLRKEKTDAQNARHEARVATRDDRGDDVPPPRRWQ